MEEKGFLVDLIDTGSCFMVCNGTLSSAKVFIKNDKGYPQVGDQVIFEE
ncbi:hypothetical protein J2S05_000340 [Alkalicoccobacillus murimartini]|uniref:Uncharacterized protein n=1 Tax=Alkalicoccobacillus murimartini TaxID=171685 RepID=A0ABT9YCI4_9BACI|nr:hypothetical protein [Alkalicoccobacillus murimartini]